MSAAVLAAIAMPALALDGLALETGNSSLTEMVRVAAQWNWQQRWFQGAGWHLGGYWDLSAAHWHREVQPRDRPHLMEIGLTPVLRLQRNDYSGMYLEGGIGAHFLSSTTLGDKRFGSNFQFGDHIGFGYRFGERGATDIGYRYQHLSNADLKGPNNGINFHQIRLQYWFR